MPHQKTKIMNYTFLIMDVFFFVTGCTIGYLINRRRLNAEGLEGFSLHNHTASTKFIKDIGKLIAYAFITSGIL